MKDSQYSNITNISENETELKTAIIFLNDEYNLKKEKLNFLINEKSALKSRFQSNIQEYQNEVKLTLEKENEIEQIFSKISKLKKRQELIMNNSLNDKFYKHLREIAENPKKEKILKNYFSLILINETSDDERPAKELIEILKDKEEIKNLLFYAFDKYSDLKKNDEETFLIQKKNCKNFLEEIRGLEGGEYPFDILIECLNIIFDIIEYENKIKENNIILAKLVEKKNAKFMETKIIELNIRNWIKKIKKIKNDIKLIYKFIDKFKVQNENSENIDKKELKNLLNFIEEYKKQEKEYLKKIMPFDSMNSLTFCTFITQSEDSSIKSGRLSAKNEINLLNSNNSKINQKKFSNDKINSQINKFNASMKSKLNFDSNKDTNDKNLKNNKKINLIKNFKKESINLNIKNNNIKNNNNISNDIISNEEKSKFKEIQNINTMYKTFDNKLGHVNKRKKNILESKTLTNKISKKDRKNPLNKIQLMLNNFDYKINKNKKELKKDNSDNIKNNVNNNNDIKEEKEIIADKKIPYNFSDLHNLGSRMNQLKFREPDESVELSFPKDEKKIENENTDFFNEDSVCDENYEVANNKRSTTNDYINKIGVKNNIVVSKDLVQNKLFMRRKNKDIGNLKIEKSVDSSTCCVSCT